MQFLKTSTFLFLLFAFGMTPVQGQSIWTDPGEAPRSEISLEWLRPNLGSGPNTDIDFLTGGYFLQGQFAISEGAEIVVDIPFAHFGSSGTESSTKIGNPYVGAQLFSTSRTLSFNLGLRLPIADQDGFGFSDALTVGSFSDLDRFSAFAADTLPVELVGNYNSRISGTDFFFRGRLGPEVLIFTGDGGGDTDLFMSYGFQGWHRAGLLDVGAGFTGRWLATEDGSFGGNSVHQFGITLQGNFESVRPGLLVRVPMDEELSAVYNYVFGLSVGVPLN